MTRAVIGLLCCVLLMAFGTGVRAHDEYGYVGVLTKVDLAKNRVTIKYKENGKDETVVLLLTPKTQITREKEKTTKAALKVGLTVSARGWGDPEDTEFEALSIRIVPAIKPSRRS